MSSMSNGNRKNLEGQKALVTGATSGIGRAIALRLARDGAEVLVHGRDAERGENVVDAISAEGGHARFVAADISEAAEVNRLAEEAGEVDILVNNAGFSWFGPTPDLDAETFDAMFASNVRSAYLLVAALAPKMAARGKGSIVNLSSMAAQVGLPGGAAYSATKASNGSDDAFVGRGVQPRRTRQRDRAGSGVHRGSNTRPHRPARRDDAPEAGRTA